MKRTKEKRSFARRIAPYVMGAIIGFGGLGTRGYISHQTTKHQIELNATNDFVDTEKPNALVTIPEKDYNDAFRNKDYKNFLDELKSGYDVNFKIISDERELYSNLDKTPNLELLVIGGHGHKNMVDFSDMNKESESIKYSIKALNKRIDEVANDKNISKTGVDSLSNKLNKELNEKYNLFGDISEKGDLSLEDLSELKEHLSNLSPNATIYIQACNAGSDDLVYKIKEIVRPDVNVIGVKGKYALRDTQIENLYPLKISVDKTYFGDKKLVKYNGNGMVYETN